MPRITTPEHDRLMQESATARARAVVPTMPTEEQPYTPRGGFSFFRDMFLVSATMGCVILCFSLVLIFHNFLLGLLVPLLAATAMKASHWLLARYRPREVDPQHRAIQESIVLGGAISVAIAFALSPHVHLLDLFYAGAATGALAALSIGWEQLWVAWERRAARKADLDAEKARRLAEDGDLVTAQEMLEDALLTTELAFGSHHQQVAKLVTYLAEVMAAQGHVAASTLMYKRSVEVYEQLHPWTHQIVFALDRYAEHLRGQKHNKTEHAKAVGGLIAQRAKEHPRNDDPF